MAKNKIDYVESLNLIPQVIKWAEKQDVERFSRFLVQQPNIPLYCFSSGGASPTLHFAALLYETNRGMAKALTGLAISSISDESLKASKILIFSQSGNGVDTKNLVDRAIAINPQGVAGLSGFNNGEDNYLISNLKKVTNNWFQYNIPHIEGTFIGSISNIASMCLVYKAFTGDYDILGKLKGDVTPSSCFAYRTKEGEELDIQRLSAKKHYIALYGGWGEPAARDFENKMVESGIASVQLCDIRNFCHGRFIFLSNHFEDCVFVLYLTPREKEYADKLIFNGKDFYGNTLFPQATEIITMETDFDSPLATIDLSIKGAVLVGQIGKTMNIDPFSPPNPCSIDKRRPRGLEYTKEMKQPLKYAVLKGNDGGLGTMSRKKLIVYDPQKTIEEIAKANGVEVPTIRKYIQEKNIDRQWDSKMLLYNMIWKEYVKDSTISKAALAEKLGLSISSVYEYLGKEAKDIKISEGKIGTVSEDTIVEELRNEVKDLQIRFEKFCKIREKYPSLSEIEYLKKMTWSNDKKGNHLAYVKDFIKMEEFKYVFKKGKIELLTKEEKAIKEGLETPLPDVDVLDSQILSEPSEGLKPELTINGYDIFCLYDFKSANLFDNEKEDYSHCCYFHAEGMYKRYTDNSGFIFAARKHGYKEIEHMYGGVKYRWEDDKMYDEYSVSLISMTTFVNPSTNDADMFSVTFRRNNTARQYSGGYKHLYREMADKVKELLGGFDFEKFCIEKTKGRLKVMPSPTPIKATKKAAKAKEIKVTEKLEKFLKQNKIDAQKLLKLRDNILAKEAVRTKEYSKNWKPITWDDFGFRKTHTYDTKKVECWSFNSGKDVRDGVSLQLGNMVNGFGVSILGIDFINSEVPYQLAIFKNDEESVKVQREIVNPSNPLFRNGLKMKRVYIYNKKYEKNRRDKDFELGNSTWCYEWMKFITWQKVLQNKGFREILLSIPKGAMIIEQAQRKAHTQWSAWNEALMKERKLVKAAFMAETGKGKTSKVVRDSIYLVNNNSKWEGENAEGQILTMAKLALYEEVNMPIDEQILNNANICWFGKYLCFTKHEDGSVTVKTSDTPNPPSNEGNTHSEAFSEATEAPIETSEKPIAMAENTSHKGIIGAVIGEVVGSRFESFVGNRKKAPKGRFDLFTSQCTFTDDSVLTVAIADSLLHKKDFKDTYHYWFNRYPKAGFGRQFKKWVRGDLNLQGTSDCDGSGMRVSPIGFYAKTLDDALERARQSAVVSHNSVEGIKGAQSIAASIFLARQHTPKDEIKKYITDTFDYDLDLTNEEVIEKVKGLSIEECALASVSCPIAIIAFLNTDGYEEAIRMAVKYNCDTDTVGCMAGGIAAAYYGVPKELIDGVVDYLPQDMIDIINEFDGLQLKNNRITPKTYDRWKGAICVFGSNLNDTPDEDGKVRDECGYNAKYDFNANGKVKEGVSGYSYAIPTIKRSLEEIKESVDKFCEYALSNTDKTFLVQEIGCISAGYSPKEIAPMFAKVKDMQNVYLPKKFREVLDRT